MNRICLVVLIGLPAAGKTTFCEQFMQKQSLPFNILHLCYDNLINFNSESTTNYRQQRESILNFLKETIIKFKKISSLSGEQTMNIHYKSYKKNDTIILCDDNHYYRSMRYKLFQIAREQSLGFCQIFFNCELYLALKRNSLRDALHTVPNDVVIQMHSRLEVPNALRSKWENNTLTLQVSNLRTNNYNEIIYFLTQMLDKPVQSFEVLVSKSSTQSEIHKLDLLLRKRIKVLISSNQNKNSTLANYLNDKRKETLKLYQKDISCGLQLDRDINEYVDMLNCV